MIVIIGSSSGSGSGSGSGSDSGGDGVIPLLSLRRPLPSQDQPPDCLLPIQYAS